MTTRRLIPPQAKKIENIITIHGETRNDEYAWLRDLNWPKVTNKEILEYLTAENKYTAQFLKPYTKLQKQFYEEFKGRIKEDDQSYPVKDKNYYYYSKTIKGKNHSIQCRKKGSMNAKEQVIFNANILAKGHPAFSTSAFNVSPNQNLLAYSTDFSGDERYTVIIKDLVTNKLSSDEVTDTFGSIVWHQSNSGFFYIKLNKKWRAHEIYYHKLGDQQENDVLVFKETDLTFHTGIYCSSDKEILFIDTSSSSEDEIWFIDITKEDLEPKLFLKRKNDQLYSVDHKNDEFYVKINDKGKNFRLIKTNLAEYKDSTKWRELIPHDENIYLTSFDLSKDYLVIMRRINGIEHITVFNNAGAKEDINFKEENYSCSAYFPTYESKLLRINYSSPITPASVLEYDFKTKKIYTRKTQQIPSGYNKNKYHTERIFAKAPDGKEIPITIVYLKSKFKKNGANPLYLYGYGSYGISIAPSFNSNIISLLNRGIIFAIAHIRGGDDLGFKWYEEAKFLNKKITFTDFISCAKHLLKTKYTAEDRLIISGGSAGGLLMGYVINEAPELFRAVVARVPFVDVLNTMLDENLPLTPGEYKEWGNPKQKEFYNYIKSYSPYDNIKKQAYPALFVTAGLSDPRVAYWEPAKWVAKLRAYSSSDNPILLYTEMESGHKGQSGRYDALKEIAKIYSFILSIL